MTSDGLVVSSTPFDDVTLTTIGIDIGSATSHLTISHVRLRRRAGSIKSRFMVVGRDAIYRSPVQFTPYLEGNLIDIEAINRMVDTGFAAAGVAPADIDAGAVIMTGVALERENATAISAAAAERSGSFICVTAGHLLEARLAAYGSGAVDYSNKDQSRMLMIDIGGGTTKLAMVQSGFIEWLAVLPGGTRLISWDSEGVVTRIEKSAARIADEFGIAKGELITCAIPVSKYLADRIVRACHGLAQPGELLAGAIGELGPDTIMLSGGAAEYLRADGNAAVAEASHHPLDYDLGRYLSSAIRVGLEVLAVPIVVAEDPIRATVTGASQFAVQLSGDTITITDDTAVPVHNVPVVCVELPHLVTAKAAELAIRRALTRSGHALRTDAVVLAIGWSGEPRHSSLAAIAEGVLAEHQSSARSAAPIMLSFERDLAASVGRILRDEMQAGTSIVAIDNLAIYDFDFIDIGSSVGPGSAIPVMVKSLLVSDRTTSAQGAGNSTADTPSRRQLGGHR